VKLSINVMLHDAPSRPQARSAADLRGFTEPGLAVVKSTILNSCQETTGGASLACEPVRDVLPADVRHKNIHEVEALGCYGSGSRSDYLESPLATANALFFQTTSRHKPESPPSDVV
jgi:hypothetical protein